MGRHPRKIGVVQVQLGEAPQQGDGLGPCDVGEHAGGAEEGGQHRDELVVDHPQGREGPDDAHGLRHLRRARPGTAMATLLAERFHPLETLRYPDP